VSGLNCYKEALRIEAEARLQQQQKHQEKNAILKYVVKDKL
jgi:hypothetical protein